MTLSFSSWSSASFVASSDPSASPSGFSCVTIRKRSWARIASATAFSSRVVVWGELIDQPCHPDPALDRRIVFERELRRPLHPELPPEPGLQDAVGGREAGEALPALRLRAEHADVDACVAEIRRRLDARNGDEADARVLQLPDRLREHLADRLVYTPHPLSRQASPPRARR